MLLNIAGEATLQIDGMTYRPDDMLPDGRFAKDVAAELRGADEDTDALVAAFLESEKRRSSRRPRTMPDNQYRERLGVRVNPRTKELLDAAASERESTVSRLAAEAIEKEYPGRGVK